MTTRGKCICTTFPTLITDARREGCTINTIQIAFRPVQSQSMHFCTSLTASSRQDQFGHHGPSPWNAIVVHCKVPSRAVDILTPAFGFSLFGDSGAGTIACSLESVRVTSEGWIGNPMQLKYLGTLASQMSCRQSRCEGSHQRADEESSS